ncbi:MAG: hypothetical protein ACLQE9_22190 [Roseiarcus sp.]
MAKAMKKAPKTRKTAKPAKAVKPAGTARRAAKSVKTARRAVKTVKITPRAVEPAKTARRAVKPWTKDDVRALKAHSKARTPVVKVSKAMKRSIGALRRKAGVLGVGLGHLR